MAFHVSRKNKQHRLKRFSLRMLRMIRDPEARLYFDYRHGIIIRILTPEVIFFNNIWGRREWRPLSDETHKAYRDYHKWYDYNVGNFHKFWNTVFGTNQYWYLEDWSSIPAMEELKQELIKRIIYLRQEYIL